jgi:hypothetical protein
MSSTAQMLPQERCPMNFSNPNSTERHYPTSRPAVFVLPFRWKRRESLLETAIFIAATGVYLAAQPAMYRKGAAQLFPPKRWPIVEQTVDDIGRALRLWLLGQTIQMCVIGAVTTAAVWLIGLPSPLALRTLAGPFAEFIPYLPTCQPSSLCRIPATLVSTLLWVRNIELIYDRVASRSTCRRA